MLKKISVAIAAAAAAALLLAGCTAGGSTDSGGSGKVTLTMLTFETPNLSGKYWDETIARTNKIVPGVTIKKLVAPNADRDAYARQLDSTGRLPDILVAISPTGLAESGKLAEFSKSELKNWINPTANSFGGKIYQLPTNTQTIPNVYYRKSAFAKAGIDSPPKTWSEFLADSAKLKAAGITPIVVNGGGSDTWADIYSLTALIGTDVYAKDPNFLSELASGKKNFSDPDFVSAAKKLKTLVDDGYIDPALLSKSYAEGQSDFLGGTGAMYPMGSWFTVAPTADQQKDLGVFAWPSSDGKLVMPTYTGGGLSVSAKAPDVKKAKEWALAWSQVTQNLNGGTLTDGLFVALKGFTPPADTTSLYKQTLALYDTAVKSGTVTTAFGNEGGSPSLPAGFVPKVNAAISDLISGHATVDAFVAELNTQYTSLSK